MTDVHAEDYSEPFAAGKTDDPDERSLDSRLAEIDENLIRGEIGPSERALLTAERKKVYEAKHPDTVAGVAGGKASGRARSNSRKVCDRSPADRFTKDTARKTGRSERAVQQDATRAKELKGDLAKTARTSLDKGAELDALKKLKKIDETVAADLVAKAQAGEEVSAAKVLAEFEQKAHAAAAPPPVDEQTQADLGRLRAAWDQHMREVWKSVTPLARRKFVSEIEDA